MICGSNSIRLNKKKKKEEKKCILEFDLFDVVLGQLFYLCRKGSDTGQLH